MTISKKQRHLQLSGGEVRRAIYIDFEGTAREPASFLGLFCEGVWSAAIIEPALFPAVVAHPRGQLFAVDRVQACRDLMTKAEQEERQIIAWSNRERDEIISYDAWTEAERLRWATRVLNALPPAKAWARRTRTEIPVIPGAKGGRENRWSLSGFRKATGYPEISSLFEPGKTASRIRTVRGQLLKRGEYQSLTPVAKAKWSKVLTHNYHDCASLAHVASIVFGDRL